MPQIINQHSDTVYVPSPPIVQQLHDTVKSIQYVPKFFNGNEVILHDTIIRDGEKIAITPEKYCSENLVFQVTSNPQIFKTGDTLTAKFQYPQMIFDFDFHSKADTIQTITNTITKLITESKFNISVGGGVYTTLNGEVRFGFGIQAGYRIL